jgi:hypothetical protein
MNKFHTIFIINFLHVKFMMCTNLFSYNIKYIHILNK